MSPEQVQFPPLEPQDEATPPLSPPEEAKVSPARGQLSDYLSSMVRQEELSELILSLEDWAKRQDRKTLEDPGLRAFVQQVGLDLTSPEAVREAVLALGARALALQQVNRKEMHLPELPRLESRDAAGISRALLMVLEATRLQCSRPEELESRLHLAAKEALDVYQRNLPPRTEEDRRWWAALDESVHRRLVPGFYRLSQRFARLEDSPFWGTLLRAPVLMGVLCALPGLITIEMPISTPVVMILLAVLGHMVVHPFWLKQVTRPLGELEENLAEEGPRLARVAGDGPWPEESFTVKGVLSDLLPILEGQRLAGRTEEDELRLAVSRYFDQIAPHFASSSTRSPRYFQHLREYAEGHVVRRYATWARARGRLEGSPFSRFLEVPILSALFLTLSTLPISFVSTRVSPLPPAIDIPLMILFFFLVGFFMPRWLPGATPALGELLKELSAHQDELDQLP